MLLHREYDRRADRQFRDLAAQHLGRRTSVPVGLTPLTLRDGRDQDLVGVLHQRTGVVDK